MRNVPLDEVDGIDRAVLAIGTDYPPGHLLAYHRHRRAQLLYGAIGIMQVETADGSWTVPPRRAVLIPPGTDHQVLMDGVTTRSLYLEPAAVPWFPARCRVVDVSPLLRELLLAAVDVPPEYDRHGRDGALVELVLHEIRNLAPLPFDLPLPARADLRQLCEAFQSAPSIRESPAEWAARLGVSTRTFNRAFLAGTGLSFQQWRQRACALRAIHLLSAGRTVTGVAAELAYDTPAAFSTMFRKQTGTAPSSFQPR
ncbi:helix-turn-helix transcriptional regulator [Saccharopolyspora indica]|uniref:AraC family transcriptional regulator n=1 Tax=Saccharopolyspora indica TaxID=1229659 RepID=UPI0022EB6841|nr:helix-turn-helix transcriptional regulator [Saccharopolyspora indica]MDA3642884.1 helix-turn-helix transcriptional regulator [Saccharopolyspora indica]